MSLTKSKFHFVGIGGIGMCGLAELLHNIGAQVTGSDLSSNVNTEHLAGLGVKIYLGHKKENIGQADVLVYSSAVKFDNPEVIAARERGIPLIPRAEALAEIMRLKRGVAVAGTHGKTTTTSLIASIFLQAKTDPTIVVGGRLDLIKSTALLGKGEWLIAEADESDGSFQKLSPEISVITNIDNDHLDHYKNFENLKKAFYEFALKVPFYGKLIVCGDDPYVREIFSNYPKRILYYGFNPENDLVVRGVSGRYELDLNENNTVKNLGSFLLNVPGRHYALNASAAIAVALAAGIDFKTCVEGLKQFQGVDRRFHYKGEASGVFIYDDYGHHPTEIKATLQGFKEKYPHNRLVVLFQPHRYSRTQSCWNEFTSCFEQADQVIITDIYAAGETPIDGVNSKKLSEDVKHSQCGYCPKDLNLTNKLIETLKRGDVFVTLGAGDGWKIGLEVLERLK